MNRRPRLHLLETRRGAPSGPCTMGPSFGPAPASRTQARSEARLAQCKPDESLPQHHIEFALDVLNVTLIGQGQLVDHQLARLLQ